MSYFEKKYKIEDSKLYYKLEWLQPNNFVYLKINFVKFFRFFTYKHVLSEYEKFIIESNKKIKILNDNLIFDKDVEIFKNLKSCIDLYNEHQLKTLPAFKIVNMQASIFKRFCKLMLGEKIGSNYFLKSIASGKSITIQRDEKLVNLVTELNNLLSDKDRDNIKNYQDFLDYVNLNDDFKDWGKQFKIFIKNYGYIWSTTYPRDPIWELNSSAIFSSLFKPNK